MGKTWLALNALNGRVINRRFKGGKNNYKPPYTGTKDVLAK